MPRKLTEQDIKSRKAQAKKRVVGEKRNVSESQKAFIDDPSVANAKNYRANVSSFIKAVQYLDGL